MSSTLSKLLLLLFTIQLLSMFSANMVYASPGVDIAIKWVDPFYEGYDEYYGFNIIAYPASKTVEFRVRVTPYSWWWPYTDKVEVMNVSIEILGNEQSFNIKREYLSR